MTYELVALGGTCYVTTTDQKTVLKGHQHCAGVHSLHLALAPRGCVRKYISKRPDKPLPLCTRLQMALDVATGVAYIHSKGVQYCDMSCRNLFLFEGFRVKLGDFGASLLEGQDFKPTFYEEAQYELPLRGRTFDDRPPITSWQRPFQGLEDREVEARYAREEFPSLASNVAGPIIQKCWNEEYQSAREVVEALTQCVNSMDPEELNNGNYQSQSTV
ncbi:kinase-like domain-containing protein [Achaetomium macrosporum]|uniref:EKC/KEOPS complex subunit BUD32 n=1 Tax=Achaetomium macrosporum TaxID=79813 RepID=A0AAN7C5L8_9PEZI|nr:kinase-like domain-containing protein [Achaetomium macrosporum]